MALHKWESYGHLSHLNGTGDCTVLYACPKTVEDRTAQLARGLR